MYCLLTKTLKRTDIVNIDDLDRFPVNRFGYTVVPVIQLTKENMNDSLVGLKVTIGLDSTESATDAGVIIGYDDNKIHVRVGAKTKKLDYDPIHVQLQVYQFEKKILFSNAGVSEKDLASHHEESYDEPLREETPVTKVKKEKKDVVEEKKQKTSSKPKSEKKKETFKPSHGIVWD